MAGLSRGLAALLAGCGGGDGGLPGDPATPVAIYVAPVATDPAIIDDDAHYVYAPSPARGIDGAS